MHYRSWKSVINEWDGLFREDQLYEACAFLQSVGLCILERSNLILDVEWMEHLLSSQIMGVKDRQGVLLNAKYKNIWPSTNPMQMEQNLAFLSLLDFTFPNVQEGVHCTPCMYVDKRTSTALKITGEHVYEREFIMTILPANLMPRIITLVCKLGTNVEVKDAWRSGILFCMNGEECEIVTFESHTLRIRCVSHSNSPQPVIQFFTSVCQDFLRNYSYELFVTCPHCLTAGKNPPTSLTLMQCRELVRSSSHEFKCDGVAVHAGRLGMEYFLVDSISNYNAVFEDSEVGATCLDENGKG